MKDPTRHRKAMHYITSSVAKRWTRESSGIADVVLRPSTQLTPALSCSAAPENCEPNMPPIWEYKGIVVVGELMWPAARVRGRGIKRRTPPFPSPPLKAEQWFEAGRNIASPLLLSDRIYLPDAVLESLLRIRQLLSRLSRSADATAPSEFVSLHYETRYYETC